MFFTFRSGRSENPHSLNNSNTSSHAPDSADDAVDSNAKTSHWWSLIKKDAIIMALIGLIFWVPKLINQVIDPEKPLHVELVDLFFQFGLALMLTAWISVYMEFRDIQKYFRDRLQEIVTNTGYLKGLDQQKLANLETDIIKCTFKNDDTDKDGSFWKFIRSSIYRFINDPYREHFILTYDIREAVADTKHGSNEEKFIVSMSASYCCRSMSGVIQPEILFGSEPDDGNKELLEALVTLRCPNQAHMEKCPGCQFRKTYCEKQKEIQFTKTDFEQTDHLGYLNPRKSQTTKEPSKPAPTSEDGINSTDPNSTSAQTTDRGDSDKTNMFRITFDDNLRKIDRVQVEFVLTFSVKKDFLFAFEFTTLTKDVKIQILHPEDYWASAIFPSISEKTSLQTEKPGLRSFIYEGWLLPESRAAFHLHKIRKKECPPNSNP